MKKQNVIYCLIIGLAVLTNIACVTNSQTRDNNAKVDLYNKISEEILFDNNSVIILWQIFHMKAHNSDRGTYRFILLFNNEIVYKEETVMSDSNWRLNSHRYKANITIVETPNGLFYYINQPLSYDATGVFFNNRYLRSGLRNPEYLMTIGNDIYYSDGSSRIFKNNNLFLTDVENLQIINGDIYYSKKQDRFSTISDIYKNDEIIKDNIRNLSHFTVSADQNNLAYIHSENNRNILYRNNNIYATSSDMLLWPRFSPDSSKLYYFEARRGTNNSLLFFVRGPDIAPIVSGPYLKPTGTGVFTFSNNSRYVATYVEKFTGGDEGLYILLNSTLLGPYRRLSNNFYFTEDSRFFIYIADGMERRFELR